MVQQADASFFLFQAIHDVCLMLDREAAGRDPDHASRATEGHGLESAMHWLDQELDLWAASIMKAQKK
ncbi:hypothetical protein AA23498_1210 [Acetobacter nitrogenifigens DSM 23921 = NBRC 105050]|uniref:Uncharacterized protein n=1 Tax=Acetobacter nitrogenifigens DSM 23921 = NBRC 105050 TaxID=1120919 RepID=A0A511XD00_9PROT|nr:hypothetical protein AA23498_1210 [Acetobacter nitrogenifigens DSM 23921 = NBRC 105050]GEN60839.1 hypothetical protein ANI02nite_27230 [Acetobacter nitrogenifigens DSM 23921 = NBRC 105050]